MCNVCREISIDERYFAFHIHNERRDRFWTPDTIVGEVIEDGGTDGPEQVKRLALGGSA